jgi:hypothetical protein
MVGGGEGGIFPGFCKQNLHDLILDLSVALRAARAPTVRRHLNFIMKSTL